MAEREVEELVRDAIVAEIADVIDRHLPSAAKEHMAIEDADAIADVLVADIIAPYIAQVARAPHEVTLADLQGPSLAERRRADALRSATRGER